MLFFSPSSIQRKLTLVIFCTSLLGLGVAGVAFEIYERASYRGALADKMGVYAETLGLNTAAALAFNHRKAAEDLLGSLQIDSHVLEACLYDAQGRVFVEYRRKGGGQKVATPRWRGPGTSIAPESMTVSRAIELNGEKAGGIAIVSDFSELHAKMKRFREISAFVLILSIMASALASYRLVRLITEPIQHLAAVAEQVSSKEDYALRAYGAGDDEVGKLVESFNQMLERIQDRDEALQGAKENLEILVEARTQELQLEVNERKLAEQKLQTYLKELKDLEAALDQHCIVARTDERGIITYANDNFCSISNFSRKELIGRDHRIINSGYHPKEYIKGLWETIRNGRVWKGELKNLAKDGKEYWVDTTIVPFSDAAGKLRQYISIRTDITAIKRVQSELQQAKEVAEAANRAKSEFLANMSHEIRTPLNGVIGMTDLVLDTELKPEQREYLETVKTSADSLLTVINDILDFSKIEAGKIDLEALEFNLRDCLESTLKTLALRAHEKGLELLCEMAPDVPKMIGGDAGRLRQVIINLVGNAIKFTHQGEVALRVWSESTIDNAQQLHFVVADTGIGIPKEKLDLIFRPFMQADTSTTRRYGGTGLGLSISNRLVAMMGGAMWVESEVGHGSEFHFTVWMQRTNAQAPAENSNVPPAILCGVKVLVVDDHQVNRRILEGLLKNWEMRPSSAESGEIALARLIEGQHAGEPYQLILADLHMPEMDGFELVRRIRERPELPPPVILMLTSAGHQGDTARCKELGVAAYLLKPIRQSELREAVARVLGTGEQKSAIPLSGRSSLEDVGKPSISLRILVAEDNLVNQRLATRLLEKRGHFVTVAATGCEALAALEKSSFDLVLMDMQMPEMDGFEATAAIRKKEKPGTHLPIVALTAHAMKGDREKCIAAGMDGYLAKPIRPEELDAVLHGHLTPQPESDRRPEQVLSET